MSPSNRPPSAATDRVPAPSTPARPTSPSVNWTIEGRALHADVAFLDLAGARAYPLVVSRQEAIGPGPDLACLSELGDTRLTYRHPQRTEVILDAGQACAHVQLWEASVRIDAAGPDEAAVERTIESILARLPVPSDLRETTPVTFWSERHAAGYSRHHRIDARPWERLSAGYTPSVDEAIQSLIGLEPPVEDGRLILWHGEPGTGKTHAIRALAHAWREWCSLHVITDPDRFLGGPMGYLIDVLTAEDYEREHREWKLVVLEDAGEILALDAREKVGQGLSRLLNVSDGLLTLGSNVLLLVTTNEPLGALHPAVHRRGCCLTELEFGALPAEQANAWLSERGSEGRVTAPTPLAELFAIATGRQYTTAQAKPRVGFAG